MKVIFLDVDGVLNCRETFRKKQRTLWPIDQVFVDRLQEIVKATDAKIVLSSVWRRHEEGRRIVRRFVKFIDVTPDTSMIRGEEIKAWLDKHTDVTRYAILDDDSDMLADQKLFQTRFETGLTAEIAQSMINYLNDYD